MAQAFLSEDQVSSLWFLQGVTTAHQASKSLRSCILFSLTNFLFSLPLSFYLVLDLPLGLLPGSSNFNRLLLTHLLFLRRNTSLPLQTLVWLLSSFRTATLYHQLDSSVEHLPCSYKSTPALFSIPQLSQTLSHPHRDDIRTICRSTSIF